jgi:pimeloyl-ACP methyl ester carboxylesterase
LNRPTSAEAQPRQLAVEECRVSVEGVGWRYQRAGSGPPLVLVHGLMGYSFSWRFTIPALAQSATVYALDLPGAGFSERAVDKDSSLGSLGRQLLRFLDAMGLASCDLLGTSHGGGVAMMAAASDPVRFRSLILVAPVNPWSARGKLLSVVLSSPLVAPVFAMAAPRLHFVQEHYLRRLYADPRCIRPGTLEGYTRPLRRPGAFEHGIGILRSWNRDLKDLESALPRISDIPTLLIWGNRDAAVDPASAVRLKTHFRQCTLVMLEGVGHLPYEEAPDEFNRVVMQFLARM